MTGITMFPEKRTTAGVLFLLFLAVHAHSQLFYPSRPLWVIKTEWFDIIYPAESASSAERLAAAADGIYDEIAALLNVREKFRVPVVITPDTQLLNGYYTPVPYNRIVLFDTEPLEDDLAGMEDTLLSVFRHELTHAITANIRSPVMQAAADIFGDAISPSMIINMPMSFMEGTAVFSESTGKEGRLNDPYTAQVPAQAKYENRFPSWKTASGASDMFSPASLPYLYGGAFHRWMAEEYGMEQYNRFLAETGKLHFYLISGIYKKIYGKSLNSDWERFRDSVQVPASTAEPEILPLSGPRRGSLIASIAVSESGIAWIESTSSGAYFWNPGAPEQKPRKLFLAGYGEHRLSFSPDGRYLLVSSARAVPSGYIGRFRVFDMEEQRFTGFSRERLRDGAFVTLGDGTLAVAAAETSPEGNALLLLRFDQGEGGEELFRLKMEENHLPVNPSDGGSGSVAFLDALGLNRRLLFWNPITGALEEAVFAEGSPSAIRYLSSTSQNGQTLLTFGWSEMDTFYRLGILNTGDFSAALQQGDLSGGVHFPVLYGDTCYYAARFALSEELGRLTVPAEGDAEGGNVGFSRSSFSLEPTAIPQGTVPWGIVPWGTEQFRLFNLSDTGFAPEKYRPASYFKRGFLFPVISADFFSSPIEWGLGFTRLTSDPAEKWTLVTSAFYHMPPMFFDLSVSAANKSRPLNWEAALSDTLVTQSGDSKRLTQGSFSTAIVFPLADYTKNWFLNTVLLGTMESETLPAEDIRLFSAYTIPPGLVTAVAALQPGFSSARSTGAGYFDVFRFNTYAFLMATLPLYERGEGDRAFSFLGEYVVSLSLPGLLPVKNPRGFTLSLPVTLTLSTAWALKDYISGDSAVESAIPFAESVPYYADTKGRTVSGVSASVVLFSAEIQRGIPLIPFVANRVILSGGYQGNYFSDYDFTGGRWLDAVSGKLALIVSPAIGTATGIQLSLDMEAAWFPRSNDIRASISGLYLF